MMQQTEAEAEAEAETEFEVQIDLESMVEHNIVEAEFNAV